MVGKVRKETGGGKDSKVCSNNQGGCNKTSL